MLHVILLILGVACLTAGAALVYPPAGLIVLGAAACLYWLLADDGKPSQ